MIIQRLKDISLLCNFLYGHGLPSFLDMVSCNFFDLLLLAIVLLPRRPLVIGLVVWAFARRWLHNTMLGTELLGSRGDLDLSGK
jgi:hypothetical protein